MKFIILFIAFLGKNVSIRAQNCKFYVDITNGTRVGNNIMANNVTYTPENIFLLKNRTQGCICNAKKCFLRRCCENGKSFDLETNTCTRSINEEAFPQYSVFNIVDVDENKICSADEEKYIVPVVSIIGDGIFELQDLRLTVNEYCLTGSDNNTVAIICGEKSRKNVLTYTGKFLITRKAYT